MVNTKEFYDYLVNNGLDFFTGVPDSLLKELCSCIKDNSDSKHNIIAANEGNAVALASGYYLSTGKLGVVYMQNSGEGNCVNPIASLLNDKVYAIPCIFIVGWRGEPGVHDEPQHIFQGEITIKLLDDLDIKNFIVSKETKIEEIEKTMLEFKKLLDAGKNVAFVIKKGALSYDGEIEYKNEYTMKREEIIQHIVKYSGEDPIISTTGKASRELFEIREANKQSHKYDFLTVGSMGHSSSIALAIAINKPNTKIWLIDGDGAAIMHLGAIPVIAANKPKNLVHILINNGSHETVGGMPTVANQPQVDLAGIAKASGYPVVVSVNTFEDLDKELENAKKRNELCMIEVKCSIGARDNLGRPTTSALENKKGFMEYLKTLK